MSIHYLQPFGTFTRQGTVTKWSPALETFSGWPSSHAVGRSLSDLMVPLIPTELPDFSDGSLGVSWEGLVALTGFQGRPPVPAHATIEMHPGGEVLVSLRNIAISEPPVREQPQPPVLVRVTSALVFEPVYPETAEATSFSRFVHELHGGLAERHESHLLENYFAVIQSGTAQSWELCIEREGQPLRIACEVVPDTWNAAGVSSALGVFRDVTRQSRKAEQDFLSLQRLAVILENMRGFCYTVDRSLVFTSSIGAGLAGLQLKPNQLVGTSLTDLWNATDPKYEPLACHLRALAGVPQTYQDECMGRSLEYRLVPELDNDGRITGVIGIGFDVTEQEHAKEEQIRLSAMLRQAQKMESIGRLAGGVAHDFNNQLTCIMGHLSLAGKLISPDSRVAHHLKQAISAVDSAAMLTRQLLAFSRKQVIVPRPLHLGGLVDRLNDMLQRVIGESIRLNISWADDLWQVHADPGQLEQVLMNLVVNARDAIETEGEIRVELRNREVLTPLPAVSGLLACGKYVELSVSDTGRGISDAIRSKLFEPFFTTKEVGAGTGLGLATVYGAVVQNNGNIIVDSKLGEGSTFSVYLPKNDDDPTSSITLEPLTTAMPIESCSGTETVLLVEDEPSLLEAAQCTLQQLGYTVLACCGPGEALRSFREHGVIVDLLVTDVVMPRMNGKELASRIQAIRPETVVLFTSGFSERILTQQGVVPDGLNFLSKPYRPIELAAKVRSVLDKRHDLPAESAEIPANGSDRSPSDRGSQQAG